VRELAFHCEWSFRAVVKKRVVDCNKGCDDGVWADIGRCVAKALWLLNLYREQ
jgi:hypothetical protein